MTSGTCENCTFPAFTVSTAGHRCLACDQLHEVDAIDLRILRALRVPPPVVETPTPLPPTDHHAAVTGLQEALKLVDDATSDEWKRLARLTLRQVAEQQDEFIGDAIWELGLPKPSEPRALGPIMLWAVKEGLIEDTGRSQRSDQPLSHRMLCRVWRSKLRGV